PGTLEAQRPNLLTSSSTSRYCKLTKLLTLRSSIMGRARSSFRGSKDRWKARIEFSAAHPLTRSHHASSIHLNRAFVSLSLSDFQDHVGLATSMAPPRILHGMPIRDLWAPLQLGRPPTRVAMYFPTPSAAALDRSLFHWPSGFYCLVLDTQFKLRAFLILVFSDIPAVSMLMRMKGHNRYSPCRMCKIIGVPIPNSNGKTLYVPLDRSTHPKVINAPASVPRFYDPANLPLRTHTELHQQALTVDRAPINKRSEELAREYGIKGLPILFHVKSLQFPQSFPYDFMHLVWGKPDPELDPPLARPPKSTGFSAEA
ncbi:hypothetical protein B0H14DRAFT_3625335, partial [Mycena olivaceomarginata]